MPQVDIKPALIRMNLDDSFYYLGKSDYCDALNIVTDSKEANQDIINTNVTGNRKVSYTLPSVLQQSTVVTPVGGFDDVVTTFSGGVNVGITISIYLNNVLTSTVVLIGTYTTILGDTLITVAAGLVTSLNSLHIAGVVSSSGPVLSYRYDNITYSYNRLDIVNSDTDNSNICIGPFEDVLRGRVFEFIWNANGRHSILIFDVATRTRTKLIENLTDTGDIDVLEFTLLNKINHCDIIYRDASEGDLLGYTDANVSPRKLNVKKILDGSYGVIEKSFIEIAKQPPRAAILSVYGSDITRNANSLRRKLIQPTYRYKYNDFELSTFNTRGKTPLPIGYYGSDNDIANTSNNFITFTVETGSIEVTDIEIAVAFNVDNVWGDFVSVIILNKAQLNIASNTTYNYLFYNDGIYPPLDQDDVDQLSDWVPKKADSMVLANGNVWVPAGITEGFDPYPQSQLDVTITAANVTNSPPDTDPPAITYTSSGSTFIFTVSGSVAIGTRYQVYIFFNGSPSIGQTYGIRLVGDYTSIGGDTIDTIAFALYNQFNSYPSVPIIGGSHSSNFWNSTFGTAGNYVMKIIVTPTSVSGISTEKTWLWDANYILGQGYKDEQGRLMPGVTTLVNPTDSNNDYLVTTPSFSLDTGAVQTPVITAEVNHLPYSGAVTFGWVRRRMTYGNFLMYETSDYQADSDYLYFCLANIEKYKVQNSQFIYGTAPITSESRIKVIAGITASAYNGNIWNQDYEILGTVLKTPTGGTPITDDVLFIKVKKPAGAISPAYSVNMLVMVYTPMANPTDIANSVYYEWAEEYAIYAGTDFVFSALVGIFSNGETVTGSTSGATGIVVSQTSTQLTLETVTGTFVIAENITGSTSGATGIITTVSTQNYHRGMTQDQTATQPAIYVWSEGDVYFHDRVMYSDALPIASHTAADTVPLMDSNWSDFFLSGVNDNGRGITIEVNARETYFPATMRFSREYQQNTNINATNRFVYLNFQDCDRLYGSILRMWIIDRYIKIGQQFKTGFVMLFNQISKDSAGSTLVAATDKLLNPIQYYVGNYGVGNSPGACSVFNNSFYYVDDNRGIDVRLAQDGNVPISVLYKTNSLFTERATLRGYNYKIYSAYDPKSNYRILAFEATDTDPAFTICFDENNNAYKSFLSYHPEMMCVIGSLLISWKNGTLYTHDSSVYNNFYGVQYPSYITPVFNNNSEIKKKFLAIGYKSLNNTVWVSDTNGNITTSQINPQTNLPQISQLKEGDYELEENVLTAALLNDANSMSDAQIALFEGDYIGGNYVIIKLILPSTKSNVLANIAQPYITYINSPRNF